MRLHGKKLQNATKNQFLSTFIFKFNQGAAAGSILCGAVLLRPGFLLPMRIMTIKEPTRTIVSVVLRDFLLARLCPSRDILAKYFVKTTHPIFQSVQNSKFKLINVYIT